MLVELDDVIGALLRQARSWRKEAAMEHKRKQMAAERDCRNRALALETVAKDFQLEAAGCVVAWPVGMHQGSSAAL